MPWEIREEDGRYCVYREGEADPITCHDTKEDAEAHLAALYANEPDAKARTRVKALGSGLVGGYGVVFTDADNKDLYGEYFTPDTNLWTEFYPEVPALYQHGLDGALGKRVVGVARHRRTDDVGAWYETQLNMHDEYERMLYQLAEAGVLHYSSASP